MKKSLARKLLVASSFCGIFAQDSCGTTLSIRDLWLDLRELHIQLDELVMERETGRCSIHEYRKGLKVIKEKAYLLHRWKIESDVEKRLTEYYRGYIPGPIDEVTQAEMGGFLMPNRCILRMPGQEEKLGDMDMVNWEDDSE